MLEPSECRSTGKWWVRILVVCALIRAVKENIILLYLQKKKFVRVYNYSCNGILGRPKVSDDPPNCKPLVRDSVRQLQS